MRKFIAAEGRISVLHGSNQAVLEPDLSKCTSNGDFGKSCFYTAQNETLAIKRGQQKSFNSSHGKATVTEYICEIGGLRVLEFENPDEDWLLAIIDGRNGLSPLNIDLVIAPIADGKNIANAIRNFNIIRARKETSLGIFERGIYSKEYKEHFKTELQDLLSEIKVVGTDMQLVFCTPYSICRLKTKSYKEYDNQNHVTLSKVVSKNDITTDKVQPSKIIVKVHSSKKNVKKVQAKPRRPIHER